MSTVRFRRFIGAALITTLLLPFNFVFAQENTEPSFSDIGLDHTAFRAVEYLRAEGIIQGYDDGTFRPTNQVTRAAAVKLAVAPVMSEEDLTNYTPVLFDDTPEDAWFIPYISYAVKNGIIDGPSKKKSFRPGDPVIKAEYFKIMMLANGIDPNSFGDLTDPLSEDVADSNEWYYPYIRYGVASSMTMISQNGTLDPGQQLTRADTALFLFRFLMYQSKRRVQALLSVSENEILIILALIENNNIIQAQYAAARCVLTARGALASRDDLTIVKGAVKIAESFYSLVEGYNLGISLQFEEAVEKAKEAWSLAEASKEYSPDIVELADQVQTIAASMADDARGMLEKLDTGEIPPLPQVLD